MSSRLLQDEQLLAFLDDVYVLCSPNRARVVFDVLQEEILRHTGVHLHFGKTKVWNKAGVEPPGVRELQQKPEEPVWVGDRSLPEDQQGLKVLGTPLGSSDFVQKLGEKRLQDERGFWEKLKELPDLQSAWLLLLYCASPRHNYNARTLPPTLAEKYAQGHDGGMWEVLVTLLGREDLAERTGTKHHDLATLPQRLGGCGLRSASRTREAAYWASWADTLPMMHQRCPQLARRFCAELEGAQSRAQSLQEAATARTNLVNAGFHDCPTWEAVKDGTRPPKPETTEPGEFAHGWQHLASSAKETNYKEDVVAAKLGRAHTALWKSQQGPCAGTHLTALPTLPETKYKPAQLRTLLLRRLRLPLQLAPRTCKCGLPLDQLGDHRAACAGVGVLQTRAVPLEGMWRRVCREAGGRVQRTGLLRDTNLGEVLPTDNRRLECVADELPLGDGRQVAVDCTLVSALKRNGDSRPRAHREEGAAMADARKRKEARYPELCRPGTRCKLVVTAMEVGGRWSTEAYDFLTALASGRSQDAPRELQGSAYHAWKRRWSAMLSVTAMKAFADTLLRDSAHGTEVGGGEAPTLGQLLGEEAHLEGPGVSRLGLR